MTLLMNRNLSGAAYNRSRYSAEKIMTHAVSRQKKTILYLSPHDKVPARPGLKMIEKIVRFWISSKL